MASYVIGDVHGCYYSLLALMDQIAPSLNDDIYFIGDLINKGRFSKKVIDQVIRWRQDGYQITVIKGNHEDKLLSLEGEQSRTVISEFKKWYSGANAYQDFFNDQNYLREPYHHFFTNTSYFIELEDYYLVHAGFNCKKNLAFTDKESMITIRNWSGDYDPQVLNNKTVIHGHQSVSLEKTKELLNNQESKVIPIDTGCVYSGTKGRRGHLTAIRLEDRALYYVVNLDNWG